MWGFSRRELFLAATLAPEVDSAAAVRALRAQPDGFAELPELGLAWAAAVAGPLRGLLEAELESLDRLGGHYLTPVDPEWQPHFPEGVLRLRGAMPERGLAIVGARAADAYGLDAAKRIARGAAERGYGVVSGGAFGVDAAAHSACIEAGGATLVVFGAGLQRTGPEGNRRIFDAALERGGWASPFACGARAAKWSFPRRNPWIAALSEATVVVQAGLRSGSLQTARAALAQGRPCWVVPGPMEAPLHAGCHSMLAAGAQVLTSPEAWAGEAHLPQASAGPETGRALWLAAGVEPASLEVLAQRAGLDPKQVAEVALRLELEGWLRAAPGGRYARAES